MMKALLTVLLATLMSSCDEALPVSEKAVSARLLADSADRVFEYYPGQEPANFSVAYRKAIWLGIHKAKPSTVQIR